MCVSTAGSFVTPASSSATIGTIKRLASGGGSPIAQNCFIYARMIVFCSTPEFAGRNGTVGHDPGGNQDCPERDAGQAIEQTTPVNKRLSIGLQHLGTDSYRLT
jgi:hypothetical protein